MKFAKFDLEPLKKYITFLSHHHLDDIITYYHLKNLAFLSIYSSLRQHDVSSLILREIDLYLKSIMKGTVNLEIKKWISDFKNNQFILSTDAILQLLLHRKHTLIQFIPYYTKDNVLSDSLLEQLDFLSTYQEKLLIKEQQKTIADTLFEKQTIKEIEKILDQTPIHINLYDIKADKSIYNNGAGKKIFGHTPQQIISQAFSELWLSLVHPKDKQKVKNRILHFKNLNDKTIEHLEYRMIDRHGNIVWYYSRASVFKRVKGKVEQVLLTGINITQLKQVEEKRRYIEAQLKETQRIAHIASYDWDIEKDIIKYTDEAYRIYGLPKNKKDFHLADLKDRLIPKDINKLQKNLAKVFEDKSMFHYEGQYRIVVDNTVEKDIFSRGHITRNKKGEPVRLFGAVMDITSLKKAEYKLREKNDEVIKINKELKASKDEIKKINADLEERIAARTKELTDSEEQYKFLVENVPQMYWTTKPDGAVDFHNKNLLTYTGSSTEMVKGWNWENNIHPDDLPSMLKKWNHSLATGTKFETEFRIKRHDGAYRWHLVRTVPLKNKKGKVMKWMGSATDINEQKKYAEELKQKNKQLIKTNKDLDNFIYTASHDLKAPISNIEGLLNALKDEIIGEKEANESINIIIEMMDKSVNKFKKTIFDLTEITKAQNSGIEETQENNLDEIMEDVLSMVDDLIKTSHAQIITDFEQCPTIKFSRKNLKSVIYNLISNAIKFRSPYRQPKVSITSQLTDKCVELSVKDNGLGFDENQKSKIFDMFKRLQSSTEGSGIGLYLVKRIVTNAGGKIKANSKPGEGSEFKIYLKKS